MTYRFTLGRGSLALLLAGWAGVGSLLFFAGMLVGVGAQPAPAAPGPQSPGALASAESCPAPAPLDAPAPASPAGGGGAVAWSPPPARYASPLPEPSRYAAADPPGVGGPGEEDEGGPYSLQVGDYPAEDRALAVLDRLADRGYSPFIVSGVDRRGRVFFHVRVERFDERAEAGDAAVRFARREGMPATVVPTEYALP